MWITGQDGCSSYHCKTIFFNLVLILYLQSSPNTHLTRQAVRNAQSQGVKQHDVPCVDYHGGRETLCLPAVQTQYRLAGHNFSDHRPSRRSVKYPRDMYRDLTMNKWFTTIKRTSLTPSKSLTPTPSHHQETSRSVPLPRGCSTWSWVPGFPSVPSCGTSPGWPHSSPVRLTAPSKPLRPYSFTVPTSTGILCLNKRFTISYPCRSHEKFRLSQNLWRCFPLSGIRTHHCS